MAIVVDSTLQHRASLHPANAKTFNHGKDLSWGISDTISCWILNDMLIPLRPIPFYSKRYAGIMRWRIALSMTSWWSTSRS